MPTSCETSQVKVHRCRMAEWVPSGIASLAFNSTSTRLAVVRESGGIEIWNVEGGWFCERSIPGPGKRIISEVLWQMDGKQERLFSAGLNGLLIEWDLIKLLPNHSSDSCGGGPVHSACLKVTSSSYQKEDDNWSQNASVALGCHDGSIRLFDTSDANGFMYVRALQRHSAPALCVDWKDDMLVSSGADGHIRIWNTKTGALKNRITVESYQDEPTMVWQVKIIDERTIVSGDSLGHVQFWDTEFGTLVDNFVPFQADVLALTVAPGGTIFASGVDPLLTKFSRVQQGKWVVSALHRSHSHDVNAIAVTQTDIISKNNSKPGRKNIVVTGGKDSQLCAFLASGTTGKPITQKLLPFLHRSPVSVAAGQGESAPRRFLLRNGRVLQLFQVGDVETKDPDDVSMLPSGSTLSSSPYHHLIDMKTDSSADGGLNLCTSDLSQDCQWAACSDTIKMSLFHFRPSKSDPLKLRTKKTPCCLPAAYSVCFTKDSKRLVAGCLDSSIMVYDLENQEVVANFDEFQQQRSDYDDEGDVDEDDITNQDGILHLLCVSNDSSRLAACDHLNRIHVFDLETLKLECTLPRPTNSPTAMAFHPDNNILVVACASNDFFLFDVQQKKIDEWSRINGASIPKTLRAEKDRIFGIKFDKQFPNRMFLMSSTFICKVDLSQLIEKDDGGSERPKKMPRITKNTNQDDTNANFRIIREFKPLLGGDFISSDELLLVEIPWIKVLEALPPTFERKKYGT